MPGPIAHFVGLCETAHALRAKNKGIGPFFNIEPLKKNSLIKTSKLSNNTEEGISQYAYFGSISPDLGYFNNPTHDIADLFHYNNSGSFAIALIKRVSECKKKDEQLARRLMTFTLGFISHIAMDVVVHPYVNILAGAYWNPPGWMGSLESNWVPFGGDKKHDLGMLRWNWIPIEVGEHIIVAMHMMTEVHQDSWLAGNYFGLDNISSTGALKSWSDFITDLYLSPANRGLNDQAKEVLTEVCSCIKEFYRIEIKYGDDLERACWRSHDALDIGYDSARKPIPDIPSINLVNYNENTAGKKIVLNSYWEYMQRGIALSVFLCEKALDYYMDETDSNMKALKTSLKDWNLDTGYRIHVFSKNCRIHVRYEHSWVHNYGMY